MKKVVYPASLAVVVISGIWWSLGGMSNSGTPTSKQAETAAFVDAKNGLEENQEDSGNHSKSEPSTESKTVSEEVVEHVKIMNARRPGRNYTHQEVERAIARRDMWSSADTAATEKIPLTEEQLHDGRQLIQFSPVKLESLQPGDKVVVDITEANTAYEVLIDRIEKHDYDSVSWYGHIDGNDGQRYQVSFTRGETLTVGGIDTPAGNYQLQAHGDAGWIASSGSLFKTEGETDAIYPPD